MNQKSTRNQRLSMKISRLEHAMMTALADRDGRTVSELVRDLVRTTFTSKFGSGIPTTDPKTSQVYIWERSGEEYWLRLAAASNVEIATPQAILMRSGGAFRITRLSKDMTKLLATQLAQIAGIEIV